MELWLRGLWGGLRGAPTRDSGTPIVISFRWSKDPPPYSSCCLLPGPDLEGSPEASGPKGCCVCLPKCGCSDSLESSSAVARISCSGCPVIRTTRSETPGNWRSWLETVIAALLSSANPLMMFPDLPMIVPHRTDGTSIFSCMFLRSFVIILSMTTCTIATSRHMSKEDRQAWGSERDAGSFQLSPTEPCTGDNRRQDLAIVNDQHLERLKYVHACGLGWMDYPSAQQTGIVRRNSAASTGNLIRNPRQYLGIIAQLHISHGIFSTTRRNTRGSC